MKHLKKFENWTDQGESNPKSTIASGIDLSPSTQSPW